MSHYGSPTLSQASSSDNETTFSHNIVSGDFPQSPPTPAADPSMPPSRFLAAFQKIRQQKSSLDHSIDTTTPSTVNGMATRTMRALPTPTSSTIGSGSKSTSFTEKIKTKFKPSWVHSSRSSAIAPPPSPRQPARQPATKKSSCSSSPTVATLQASPSSTSIMNRSWSHFSRPFSSPSSLKYSSLHYPQQTKHQQHNEMIEGQMSPLYGKRTSSPSHRHSSRNLAVPPPLQQHQHQQQRLAQIPILPSAPIQSSGRKEYRHNTISRTIAPVDHRNGTSAIPWDYSFDTASYIPRSSIIISPTCSTSSQHSSKSSLSVTASSSTSASSSPTSLSADLPHDSKKPLDLRIDINGIPGSTSKSTAPYSPVSHWSLSPAQSGYHIDSPTSTSRLLSSSSIPNEATNTLHEPTATTVTHSSSTNSFSKRPSPHLALKSTGDGNGIKGNRTTTTCNESLSTKPKTTKSRSILHLKTTASNNNSSNNKLNLKKKKKKHHVRFVSTAKVQDTFSKYDYDRASDPYAICTRLTAHLAQQIKDELNAFKLEEMLVHHQSRGNTQFFM
ncbi:hypothetical protein BCR42DRAFT_402275 [Absidia repens]|uniref:Uncharacterized protein n=1 Tax=Absidia repens TaxID=90262 RepID=A0A1X2IXT8_9FUNG|nr:hypothetical protein BCR42DRAFT_402275 [Absidia repens]